MTITDSGWITIMLPSVNSMTSRPPPRVSTLSPGPNSNPGAAIAAEGPLPRESNTRPLTLATRATTLWASTPAHKKSKAPRMNRARFALVMQAWYLELSMAGPFSVQCLLFTLFGIIRIPFRVGRHRLEFVSRDEALDGSRSR